MQIQERNFGNTGSEIMRVLLFVVSFLCVAFLSCSFSSQSSAAQKSSCDTVVCSERIRYDPPSERREFFVVINQDTSAYSCIINSYGNECVSVELICDSKGKYFMNVCGDDNDTTAVGEDIWIDPEREFRIPCYKDMLHEIDLCLAAVSKDKDVTSLRSFRAFLSDLGDIAVLTTNNLNSHFVEKNGEYRHSDIVKALEMTFFAEDLNGMLNKYGVEVGHIFCEGIRYRVERERYLKIQNISKDIKVPDYVMDVEVIVRLKKLEKAD